MLMGYFSLEFLYARMQDSIPLLMNELHGTGRLYVPVIRINSLSETVIVKE